MPGAVSYRLTRAPGIVARRSAATAAAAVTSPGGFGDAAAISRRVLATSESCEEATAATTADRASELLIAG